MVFSLTLAIMSDKITNGTTVMINTLQKLIYSRCQIMFILCFMPKRSIWAHRYPSVWPLKTF